MQKNILIIDEERFSRVCSAILGTAGYGTDVLCQRNRFQLQDKLDEDRVNLIVTSYPYGSFLFSLLKGRNIPTILLSDNVDGDLIDILKNCENVYCMIKPLDYDHFKQLVGKLMSGDLSAQGGYSLV
jgi:hypothetical protein